MQNTDTQEMGGEHRCITSNATYDVADDIADDRL